MSAGVRKHFKHSDWQCVDRKTELGDVCMRILAGPVLLLGSLLASCSGIVDGGWESDMTTLIERQKLECLSGAARQEAFFNEDATGDKAGCHTNALAMTRLVEEGPPTEKELEIWRETLAWEKEYIASFDAAASKRDQLEEELTVACAEEFPNRWTPEQSQRSSGDALADTDVMLRQMEDLRKFERCVGDGKFELQDVGEMADEDLATRGIELDQNAEMGSQRFYNQSFRSLYAQYEASQRD